MSLLRFVVVCVFRIVLSMFCTGVVVMVLIKLTQSTLLATFFLFENFFNLYYSLRNGFYVKCQRFR